jgi:V/A-type H+-transporting ATPase subunit E
MGGGEVEVLTNKEAKIESTTLQKISSKISKEMGVKTAINLSKEKINTLGGVIARNKDGNIEVNNTIETLIANAKTSLRSKIATILFSLQGEK